MMRGWNQAQAYNAPPSIAMDADHGTVFDAFYYTYIHCNGMGLSGMAWDE